LSYLWVRYDISSLHLMTINKRYKMADNDVSFVNVPSFGFLLKRRFPPLIFTTDFSVCMEMCAWVLAVLDNW